MNKFTPQNRNNAIFLITDLILLLIYLTLCLPWGPMDPKIKFDHSLLRTHSEHDFDIT